MNPIGFNKRNIKAALVNTELSAKVQQLSNHTTDFLSRLSNSTTEVILDFLGKNAKQIRLRDSADSLYCYNNLLLMRTNGQRAYDLEQNVREIEEIGIAPRFVQYFQLGNDDFLTVLEAPEEQLLSYTENIHKVVPKAKQDFKLKLRDVFNKGFNNKEIFANKDAFLVSKNGDKIYFADWTNLERISGTKKTALENLLKSWQF